MQAYDFKIEYVKGKNNVVVDALSRRPATLSLLEISTDWKAHLLVEYSKNRFTCEILDGQVQDDRYRVIDDVIYYNDRIYLVSESKLKEKIMQASHNSPLAGHLGYLKAYRSVCERISWNGPQRGRVETCPGMPHLPIEQSRAYLSNRTPTTITHSKEEMGEHIDGFHHRDTTGTGEGLHLCGGR